MQACVPKLKPVLVIQEIHTRWDKTSTYRSDLYRGEVPETIPLPIEMDPQKRTDFLHHIVLPWSKVKEQTSSTLPTKPFEVGCLILYPGAQSVKVECRYTRKIGAPVRYWMDRDFELVENEWLQVIYNGRFTGYDDYHWYEKQVINVGLFSQPTPTTLMERQPTHRFSAMSLLY